MKCPIEKISHFVLRKNIEEMDSVDLLAREDEFKKLNKQLEKKTESLMKQIEKAMQKQDIFSEFSHNLTLSPHHTPNINKHCCNTPKFSSEHSTPVKTRTPIKKSTSDLPKKAQNKNINKNQDDDSSDIENGMHKSIANSTNSTTCAKNVVCDYCVSESRKERVSADLEFLYAFVSVSVQEKVLPPSFLKDRATVESVCKFLSSKVKLMQEQIDTLQSTIKKKAAQCEVHLTHQAELEEERMSLLNKSNNHQAAAAEMKAKCQVMMKKLEEKDRLYKEQRSESDKLCSEVKRLRARVASAEARSATLEGTVDTLKTQLEAAKKAEKDFRDSTRSLSSSHESTISQLEARIKTLTTRVQRQERLVHNLREQRALLMAEGAVKALESEYSDFLLKDF